MSSLRFSLLACGIIGALAGSPAAHAQDVAVLVAFEGDVSIMVGDRVRGAELGLGLSASDTVVTDFDAAAILHLNNNYLVRVDEGLELRVGDILMLGAPPRTLDAPAQLAELLGPGERQKMDGVDEAERIAGWHARLTAATAPAASEGSSTRGGASGAASVHDGVVEEAVADERDSEKFAAEFAAPAPQLPPIIERVAAQASKSQSAVQNPDAAPARHRNRHGADAAVAPAPPPEPLYSEETLRAQLLDDGTLHTCLVQAAMQLPVPITQLELRLRVRDGVVSGVSLQQALPVPACARDALVGATVGTSEPQLEFIVPVPRD